MEVARLTMCVSLAARDDAVGRPLFGLAANSPATSDIPTSVRPSPDNRFRNVRRTRCYGTRMCSRLSRGPKQSMKLTGGGCRISVGWYRMAKASSANKYRPSTIKSLPSHRMRIFPAGTRIDNDSHVAVEPVNLNVSLEKTALSPVGAIRIPCLPIPNIRTPAARVTSKTVPKFNCHVIVVGSSGFPRVPSMLCSSLASADADAGLDIFEFRIYPPSTINQ